MKKFLSFFLSFLLIFSLLSLSFIPLVKGETVEAFEEQKQQDLALFETFSHNLKTSLQEKDFFEPFASELPTFQESIPPTPGKKGLVSYLYHLKDHSQVFLVSQKEKTVTGIYLQLNSSFINQVAPYALEEFFITFGAMDLAQGTLAFESLINHLTFLEEKEEENTLYRQSRLTLINRPYYLLVGSSLQSNQITSLLLITGEEDASSSFFDSYIQQGFPPFSPYSPPPTIAHWNIPSSFNNPSPKDFPIDFSQKDSLFLYHHIPFNSSWPAFKAHWINLQNQNQHSYLPSLPFDSLTGSSFTLKRPHYGSSFLFSNADFDHLDITFKENGLDSLHFSSPLSESFTYKKNGEIFTDKVNDFTYLAALLEKSFGDPNRGFMAVGEDLYAPPYLQGHLNSGFLNSFFSSENSSQNIHLALFWHNLSLHLTKNIQEDTKEHLIQLRLDLDSLPAFSYEESQPSHPPHPLAHLPTYFTQNSPPPPPVGESINENLPLHLFKNIPFGLSVEDFLLQWATVREKNPSFPLPPKEIEKPNLKGETTLFFKDLTLYRNYNFPIVTATFTNHHFSAFSLSKMDTLPLANREDNQRYADDVYWLCQHLFEEFGLPQRGFARKEVEELPLLLQNKGFFSSMLSQGLFGSSPTEAPPSYEMVLAWENLSLHLYATNKLNSLDREISLVLTYNEAPYSYPLISY